MVNKKNDYRVIVAGLVTHHNAVLLVKSIDLLRKRLYETTFTAEQLEKLLATSEYALIRDHMHQQGIGFSDLNGFRTYLDGLKEFVVNAKQMTLYVRNFPPSGMIAEIHQTALSLFDADVLLHVEIDDQMIGGMVIEFDGYYANYSWNSDLFSQKINAYFPR